MPGAAMAEGDKCDITICRGTADSAKTFTLSVGGVLRIGRGVANDVVLDFDGVSVYHAEIHCQKSATGQLLCIRDESRNGTAVRAGPHAETPNNAWEPLKKGALRILPHGWQILMPLNSRKNTKQLVISARLLSIYVGSQVPVGGTEDMAFPLHTHKVFSAGSAVLHRNVKPLPAATEPVEVVDEDDKAGRKKKKDKKAKRQPAEEDSEGRRKKKKDKKRKPAETVDVEEPAELGYAWKRRKEKRRLKQPEEEAADDDDDQQGPPLTSEALLRLQQELAEKELLEKELEAELAEEPRRRREMPAESAQYDSTHPATELPPESTHPATEMPADEEDDVDIADDAETQRALQKAMGGFEAEEDDVDIADDATTQRALLKAMGGSEAESEVEAAWDKALGPGTAEAAPATAEAEVPAESQAQMTAEATAEPTAEVEVLEELPKIRLADSLHAPNQQLREELVPAAKAIPIEKLLQLVDNHVEQTSGEGKRQRTVMMSYVLLKGVNDSPAHAAELAALLAGRPVIVNLIPYNAFEGNAHAYEEPSPQTVDDFLQILADSDIRVFERRHHGRDIAAACGQLAKLEGPKVCDIDIENAGCILNKDLARRPQAPSQGDSETPEARHWRTLLAGGVGLAILAAAMAWHRRR